MDRMDWLVPAWPAPQGVRAVCTMRAGGVSSSPYASLNLGDHVGDDPQCVASNRAILAREIGARPVYLKQIHGSSNVVALDRETADGTEADGCWTSSRGVACTIMVADCLPVLLAADDGSRVGAAHAGWRGLSGGIVESTVRAMTHDMDGNASSLIAWLGPAIGPRAFEVGDDVKAAFIAHDPAAAEHFKPLREGKWHADLIELTRMRLNAVGIARIFGNDGSREWCTVANPSRFFSHRRDRVSGRLAAAVWLS